MGENFFKGILLSVLLITLIFLVGTEIKFNNLEKEKISDKFLDDVSRGQKNEITGYVAHSLYSGFNHPESARIDRNKIYVEDDIVFKAGWYSVNGSAWRIFYLSGDFYESASGWIRGSATGDIPDLGSGEHYVIVYSCSRNNSWDCKGNKWQLIIINNTRNSESNFYSETNMEIDVPIDNSANTNPSTDSYHPQVNFYDDSNVYDDSSSTGVIDTADTTTNQFPDINSGDVQNNSAQNNLPVFAGTCYDGIKNGNEIFTDCGGSCVPCDCVANLARACYIENGVGYQSAFCNAGKVGSWSSCILIDCSEGYHKERNLCVLGAPIYSGCDDGVQNGDETGVDCGGGCSVCASVNYQRIFYVSAVGSDSNSGLSVSAPWRTLAHVNRQTFRAGDAILFRRGDTWYGSLNVSNSGTSSAPITFGAYGSGNKPVISGFTTISGWISNGGGTYYKQVSVQSSPLILLVDGKNTPKGRWPNTGWWLYDYNSGNTAITDSDLNGRNFNGGEFVTRINSWITYRTAISSHSGSTITFPWAYSTMGVDYSMKGGQGYFIQNDIDTFDIIGDWAYVNDNLYMYFGSNSPSNYDIKVSTIDQLVYLNNKQYITFDNLAFEGANLYAIQIRNSRHISVVNCKFENLGGNGIYGPWDGDSSYMIVENSDFNEINNCGIRVFGDHEYATIKHNTFKNIGMIHGLAGYSDGSAISILSIGKDSLIEYNVINYSGYNGITFEGANTKVRHNLVVNSCQKKDDCGGIYTYNDKSLGKEISDNIVLNGKSNSDGLGGYLEDGLHENVYHEDSNGHGIYIDGSHNVFIARNTVAHNMGAGIFINTQALNINVQENTAFNNSAEGVLIISNRNGGGSIRGFNMGNNILFARDANQEVLYFATGSGDSDVTQIGTVDNNYYARPIKESGMIRTQINIWGGPSIYRSLSEWKTYSTLDLNSRGAPKTITNVNDLRFEYNYGSSGKIINLDGNYIDVKGTVYSGSVTLQPYTSVVLIKN